MSDLRIGNKVLVNKSQKRGTIVGVASTEGNNVYFVRFDKADYVYKRNQLTLIK